MPTLREAAFLLILTGAGVLGNYLNVTLFFGVNFIFGSVATMMALRLSGTLWGTIVGVAIGSYTIVLWGHPYAMVIFGLEAFVVGFFLCGLKKDNAVLIDAGFWLVAGMPLVWLFYTHWLGLPETAVDLIMLKQAVNGIFNVVIATLVLHFTPLRSWVRGRNRQARSWPLQQVLNTLFAGTILTPILIVTAISTRSELEDAQTALDQRVSVRLNYGVKLLSEQVDSFGKLAMVVAGDAVYEPEHAKQEVDFMLNGFPEFLGFAVVKANGVVVGSYRMSKDLLDQYMNILPPMPREITLLWQANGGGDGAPGPLAIVAFVAEHDVYVIARLRPDFLARKLSNLADDESWKLDLRDREGRLIASSNTKLDLRDFVPGDNPHHLLPANTGLPAMVRWRKSYWIHQEPIGIGEGWSLTYAGSMATAIDDLQEDYVEKLFLAFVMSVLALMLAPLLARGVHRPLAALTSAAEKLSQSIDRTDVSWPSTGITEISSLVDQFKYLVASVSEKQTALKTLQQSASRTSDRLQGLIDTANSPIIVIDTEGRVLEWNPASSKILKLNKEEILGEKITDFVDAGQKEIIQRLIGSISAGGDLLNYILPLTLPDGGKVVLSLCASVTRDHDQNVSGALIIGQDITELTRVNEERERLVQAVEKLEECLVLFDSEDRFVFCNEAYRTLNRDIIEFTRPGIRFEDHLRAGLRAGLIPEGIGREDEWVAERMARHLDPQGSFEVLRQDGTAILVNEQKLPDGSTVLMISDITEIKQTQAQIIQASKLATLGEMATSVAHELNQPLNVIRMAAGNSRRKLAKDILDPDYLDAKLRRIEGQTERAAAIIDHMRMFGRKADEPAKAIDPVAVVNNALDLVSEQLRLSGIDVIKEFPENCLPVLGHTIQLEQVILNLVTNARDAMADASCEKCITLRIIGDGDVVRIETEDRGSGIPEANLPRIFEPFFTTKEMGKGTGLGLSVSYGIVRDMGGSITAKNTDSGAKFTVNLPVMEAV